MLIIVSSGFHFNLNLYLNIIWKQKFQQNLQTFPTTKLQKLSFYPPKRKFWHRSIYKFTFLHYTIVSVCLFVVVVSAAIFISILSAGKKSHEKTRKWNVSFYREWLSAWNDWQKSTEEHAIHNSVLLTTIVYESFYSNFLFRIACMCFCVLSR